MKKICIALLASLACLFTVSCDKQEDDAPLYTTNSFKVEAPEFVDENGSKVYLRYTDEASSLIYEEGDKVYINGKLFTLVRDGGWRAISDDGEPITGKRFLVTYVDGEVSHFDSAAGTYQFNLNATLASSANNKIILGGVAENAGDYVIKLKPACAILRIKTGGAGASWTYARVGFEANKVPKTGTINVSNRTLDAGGTSNYLAGVAQGGYGQFLNMRYSNPSTTGEDDYWYVAIPIEGNSVTTTLYLEWNNGSSTVQYKTQGQVTLRKGYVYTLGTTRQSPFYAEGFSKCSYLVSPSTEVLFSAGNLQFQRYRRGSSYVFKWKFANSQRNYIGGSNVPFVNGEQSWFDLMAYGTSTYDSKFPHVYSADYDDLYNGNLAGTNYDWGRYIKTNPGIYYGTNLVTSENWRTLTSAEWNYLISRPGKCGLGTVAGVHGLILLPDYGEGGSPWSLSSALPSGSTVTFTANTSSWNANVYQAQEWDQLEMAGAIFLPAAGYRENNIVESVGSIGYYWSSSINPLDDYQGMALQISPGAVSVVESERIYGSSVRLVIEVSK